MEDKVMRRAGFVALVTLVAVSVIFTAAFAAKIGSVPFREKTLRNGLKVFAARTSEVPLVSFYMIIPAGGAVDGPGKEGVANLTAELLLKGAAGMSAEEIAEAIDGLGGELYSSAGRDYTVLSGNFMARDFTTAMDYLSKVVLRPDFPREEIDRQKELVISSIRSIKENPSSFATRQTIRFLAGDHPYAHPVTGYESSVAALTRDDVLDFYRNHYVPRGAVLAVVGDLEPWKVFREVSKRFSSWKGKGGRAKSIPAIDPDGKVERKVIVIDKPDATQSQIRIGCFAPPRNSSEYFPLLVANNILGGGFTSRLMDEIRVNRGLTYGARSVLLQYLKGGFFGVSTFTKNKTLRETIDVALAEVEKIGKEPVSAEELEKAKRYLAGLFPFELEAQGDIARWLAQREFYSIPYDYINKYRELVNGVTAEDVKRVAGEYFRADDNLILLITNYSETRDQLEGLGPVDVIPIDEVE